MVRALSGRRDMIKREDNKGKGTLTDGVLVLWQTVGRRLRESDVPVSLPFQTFCGWCTHICCWMYDPHPTITGAGSDGRSLRVSLRVYGGHERARHH